MKKSQGQNCRTVRVTGPYNYQDTQGDLLLRHVPGTCSIYIFVCVCVRNMILFLLYFPVTCPCYTVPYVRTTHDFVAATCACDVTPRVRGLESQRVCSNSKRSQLVNAMTKSAQY